MKEKLFDSQMGVLRVKRLSNLCISVNYLRKSALKNRQWEEKKHRDFKRI
jgi:hypothetical protein